MDIFANDLNDTYLKFPSYSCMSKREYKYFKEKDDKASAFGALNYAFGWLDAGKSIDLFEEK